MRARGLVFPHGPARLKRTGFMYVTAESSAVRRRVERSGEDRPAGSSNVSALTPCLGGKDMAKSAQPDEKLVTPSGAPQSAQMPDHWMELHPRWWFFWHDCPFGMPGDPPMFEASILRPRVKAMVQCALIEGHLTWEYLEVNTHTRTSPTQHTYTQSQPTCFPLAPPTSPTTSSCGLRWTACVPLTWSSSSTS